MIILSGTVLNFTLGDNGIFKLAKNTSKNWQNSIEIETNELENLDNNIKHVISSNRGSITINKEEYDELKLDVANLKKTLSETNETINQLRSMNNWKHIGRCEISSTLHTHAYTTMGSHQSNQNIELQFKIDQDNKTIQIFRAYLNGTEYTSNTSNPPRMEVYYK